MKTSNGSASFPAVAPFCFLHTTFFLKDENLNLSFQLMTISEHVWLLFVTRVTTTLEPWFSEVEAHFRSQNCSFVAREVLGLSHWIVLDSPWSFNSSHSLLHIICNTPSFFHRKYKAITASVTLEYSSSESLFMFLRSQIQSKSPAAAVQH